MNTVVLGASGFLGSAIANSLSRSGHEVTGISRSRRPASLAASVRYVQSAIDDATIMANTLKRAEVVIHAAWDTTPGTSHLQPLLEVSSNLVPGMRLLETLQSFPQCRLVFISSGGAVFSNTVPIPYSESAGLWPRSYYGASKIAMEQMLKAYCSQTGNSVFVVRPANVYGPGQYPKRSFGVVPTMMECLRLNTSFEIWGDGKCVRDYLYIEDFEQFTKKLVEHSGESGCYQIFNVGTGVPMSLNNLCETLELVSGRNLRRTYVSARPVDLSAVALDPSHSGRVIGWRPGVAIEEGLKRTWEWYLNH